MHVWWRQDCPCLAFTLWVFTSGRGCLLTNYSHATGFVPQATENKYMSNQDDIFNDDNKVESGRVQWGAIGDYVHGTLTSVRDVSYQDGKKGKVYELLVIKGEYHSIKEDANGNEITAEVPTVLEAGDYVRVNGKTGMDDDMKKIKIGQNVGLKYEKLGDKKPGKKRFKQVTVYQGGMNEEYLASQNQDGDIPNDLFGGNE